jgi:hypothetical protein
MFLFGQPENATKAMHLAFEERAAGSCRRQGQQGARSPADVSGAGAACVGIEGNATHSPEQDQHRDPWPRCADHRLLRLAVADVGRDLKTTWALPSSPRPEHIDQMAIYSHATGKPFELVYVTPKKHAIYPINAQQAAEGMARVRRGALAIQHMLGKVESGEDALRLYTPDYSSYLWSAEMVTAANRVLEGAAA